MDGWIGWIDGFPWVGFFVVMDIEVDIDWYWYWYWRWKSEVSKYLGEYQGESIDQSIREEMSVVLTECLILFYLHNVYRYTNNKSNKPIKETPGNRINPSNPTQLEPIYPSATLTRTFQLVLITHASLPKSLFSPVPLVMDGGGGWQAS